MSWLWSTRFASILAVWSVTCVGSPAWAEEAPRAPSENTVEPEELTLDETPKPKAAVAAEPSTPALTPAPAPAPTAHVEERATRDESREDAEPASEEGTSERKIATSKDGTRFGIFANPVGVLLGFYGLELDLSPTQAASINFNGVYYNKTTDAASTTAYGIDTGVQFFLSGNEQMAGAYIYPRVGYAMAKATAQTTTSTMSSSYPYYPSSSHTTQTVEVSLYGIGATVGYQWNWHPIALRIGGGLMYYTPADSSSSGSSDTISMKGTSLLVDLALGLCS